MEDKGKEGLACRLPKARGFQAKPELGPSWHITTITGNDQKPLTKGDVYV